MKKSFLSIPIFLLYFFQSYAGNVITVTNSNDSGGGSLRVAVNNLASSGDTIEFAPSLFGDTIHLTSGQININQSITIIGLGDDSTIISGNNSSRIFKITAGDSVSIERLTLLKGMPADSGGAIYNSGSLNLMYCVLKNNTGTHGGGIVSSSSLYLYGCTLTNNFASSGFGGAVFSSAGVFNATNSTFQNNTSVSGGGAIACNGSGSFSNLIVSDNFSNVGGGIHSTGPLTMTNSTVSSNNANFGNGGGIYNSGNAKITGCDLQNNRINNSGFSGGAVHNISTCQITASTVSSNFSAGSGGGISNTANLTIVNSTISGNSANSGQGGGISSSGESFIGNSTISANTSSANGGGIASSFDITIERSTITGNDAGGSGGGISNGDALEFSNSIIANNSADGNGPDLFNASGTPTSLGHNLVSDIAQAGFIPGMDDILGTTANPVDAKLGALANNGSNTRTHLPLCGSPAIDAGDSTGAPSTDQRGETRFYGIAMDIGAVEVQTDPVDADAVITDESITGAGDGVLEALITGGTEPYFYDWSTGSQQNTISNLNAGNYGLTVSDFFGCTDSAIFTVSVIDGIREALNETISIFPNPATEVVLLQVSPNDAKIEIFDFSGREVRSFFLSTSIEFIDIPVKELPNGNYLLKLIDTKGIIKTGKFLKQ